MGFRYFNGVKKAQDEVPVLNCYFSFAKPLVYTRDQHLFNHLRRNLIFSYRS